jgi:multiple sugar transport system permease protein
MARDVLIGKQDSVPVRFVRGWDWKKTAWVILFLAPYLIGFIVFMGGPIAAVLGLSFTKWDIITPPVFVKLENYRKILFHDKMFWTSLRNTITYMVMVVPLEVIIAFCLSVLINRRIRGINIYRAIFFMPFVLSLASIGLLWTWLYPPLCGSTIPNGPCQRLFSPPSGAMSVIIW